WGKYAWRSGPTIVISGDGMRTIPAGRFEGAMPLILLFYTIIAGIPVFFYGGIFLNYFFEGAAILVGVLCSVLSFSRLRQKRRMEDTPLSTVRAMAPGQVELAGVTVGPPPFKAPLTGS